MADESDKQDAPKLPPKLNLRKQGVLKQDVPAPADPPAASADAPADARPTQVVEAPVKQSTARLVVKPAQPRPEAATEPDSKQAEDKAGPDSDEKQAPAPIAAAVQEAAKETVPTIKLKPLKPKPTVVKSEDPPPAKTEERATPTDSKRKTSRIPLDSARPAQEKDEAKAETLKPKTIKIKPSAPVPKVRGTQPLAITLPIAVEDSDKVTADAAKRQTSRIPLEDALTADKEPEKAGETGEAGKPKTIKIKRPGSEAATVKVKKSDASTPDKADSAEMSKTARLDQLPLDEADNTPTQKKTIRVKRPDAATPSAASSGSGLGLTPPEPIDIPHSDEPGVVWAILALAASLVLCVTIYMFAAQAWGPNASGTALSSWPGGPSLSWPGNITN